MKNKYEVKSIRYDGKNISFQNAEQPILNKWHGFLNKAIR